MAMRGGGGELRNEYRIVVLVWALENPNGQGVSFKDDRYERACDHYCQQVGQDGIKKVMMTLDYGFDSIILWSWESA